MTLANCMLHAASTELLVDLLTDGLLADGGATILCNGRIARSGWAVSRPGGTTYRTLPEFQREAPAVIAGWRRDEGLLGDTDPDWRGGQRAVGVWQDHDDGTIYLDITEILPASTPRAEVLSLAQMWDQKAVCRIDTGEVISVPAKVA